MGKRAAAQNLFVFDFRQGTRSFTATSRQSKDKEDKIKVLFFGSDSFSVPHLEALIQEKSMWIDGSISFLCAILRKNDLDD